MFIWDFLSQSPHCPIRPLSQLSDNNITIGQPLCCAQYRSHCYVQSQTPGEESSLHNINSLTHLHHWSWCCDREGRYVGPGDRVSRSVLPIIWSLTSRPARTGLGVIMPRPPPAFFIVSHFEIFPRLGLARSSHPPGRRGSQTGNLINEPITRDLLMEISSTSALMGLTPTVPPVQLIDMKASHHYWDPPSRHQDIFLTVKLTTHR